MQGEKKDGWDKSDVILKPLGGLLTALAVGAVGFFGSRVLDRRQALDTDVRLYAQLMSQREEAETSLRKDMFNSIIGTFLKSKSIGYKEKVLNLELLAYNFHEALDLAPLFKDVYRQIEHSQKQDAKQTKQYLDRLEVAAKEVKTKQIAALEDAGEKLDATIDLEQLDKHPEGMKVMEGTLSLHSKGADGLDPALEKAHFEVQALLVDRTRKEIRVKLEVRTSQEGTDALYSVFWISPFDFPMIDNTRLSLGQRCAIVLRNFLDSSAEITLVYFPGSRASLKEKPFFDEAMRDLLHTRNLLGEEKTK